VVAIVALAVVACSGDAPFTPPGANLAASVDAYHCSAGCGAATGPIDTLHRGDTTLVRLSVADTAGDKTPILLRAACAVNVTILGGAGPAPTLPAAPTCPDSTVALLASATPYQRDFVWVVPPALPVGEYTLRGDMVVDPPVRARRTVRID
jgi:hypothetical protein